MHFSQIFLVCLITNILSIAFGSIEEDEHGVIYANKCEACKVLATELQDRLSETGKSRDVIETGYIFFFLVMNL